MYDFTTAPNRRHTNCYKWNIGKDEISMGVADMDFFTAPTISEAVRTKAAMNIYGYTAIPDVYYEAVANWMATRHACPVDPQSIIFNHGVMPSIGATLQHLTQPGDKVLLLTPVYLSFFHMLKDADREIVQCRLDDTENGFVLNRNAFEKAAADEKVKVLLLSNPHNPTGHIWTAEELQFMAQVCAKHNVFIISDEIHGDIAEPGTSYLPFIKAAGELAKNSVTAISISKTFNCAAIHSASLIVPDPELKAELTRIMHAAGITSANTFAIEAALAAYSEGAPWVDEMNAVIAQNKKLAIDYLYSHCPGIRIQYPQATYLIFVDCRALGENTKEFPAFLREAVGLIVNDGADFGAGGEGFVRINLACPQTLMFKGLERFVKAWSTFNQ